MKKTIVFTAIAASIAGSAYAQAIEPASQTVDWSGFYAGATTSSDSGSTDYTFSGRPHRGNPFLMDGSMSGGFAGYNVQNGAFVYGGEVAYVSGSTYVADSPTYEFTNFIDVKARAGYAFESVLVFGVVGISSGPWTNALEGDYEKTGISYGVGMDILVTDRVFVGTEFLTRSLSGGFAPLNPTAESEHNISSLQIRAGIKF